MKELIPMNEYGLMADNSYIARVDSRMVAEVFGERHFHAERILGSPWAPVCCAPSFPDTEGAFSARPAGRN